MATTYYADISIGRDQRIVAKVAGPVDSIPEVAKFAKAYHAGSLFLVYAEEDGEPRPFTDTEETAFVAELERVSGRTFRLHPVSD